MIRIIKGLTIPMSAFVAGLRDHKIKIALRPAGKERMRRLMNVVGYDLFANQREEVLYVAIKP